LPERQKRKLGARRYVVVNACAAERRNRRGIARKFLENRLLKRET